MADNNSLDTKLTEISKHIQDQARFTRVVIVICTAGILAVLFWLLTQIFSMLPDMVTLSYLNKMPVIVHAWKLSESRISTSNKTTANSHHK